MFYLTLHGAYYGYMANGHMVNDHSDGEKGNPWSAHHGRLFPISSKRSFVCTNPDRIAHTVAFDMPVVKYWLEREISSWVHHEEWIREPITP